MISSTWFKGIGKGNHASSFIAGGLGGRFVVKVAFALNLNSQIVRRITLASPI
jgi:hypothetical protein